MTKRKEGLLVIVTGSQGSGRTHILRNQVVPFLARNCRRHAAFDADYPSLEVEGMRAFRVMRFDGWGVGVTSPLMTEGVYVSPRPWADIVLVARGYSFNEDGEWLGVLEPDVVYDPAGICVVPGVWNYGHPEVRADDIPF